MVSGDSTPGNRQPSGTVYIWASLGALIPTLQVYVWIRWIIGPYFERVPTGPSDPPILMKTILSIWTAGVLIGLPFAIYWWIIRPWWCERRITLDAILLVSTGLMFFQDPFLNYLNTWCTYNTWMFHPDLPMPRQDSGYLDKDGELVLPDGAEVPKIVPFEREN